MYDVTLFQTIARYDVLMHIGTDTPR